MHILYHITFNLISYMAIIHLVVNTFGMMYSPVHCHEHMVSTKGAASESGANITETSSAESAQNSTSGSKFIRPTFLEVDCHYEKIDALSLGFHELQYIFAFIFLLGPLRLFLKIKEGKTSIEKMVEDYEDERGFMDNLVA